MEPPYIGSPKGILRVRALAKYLRVPLIRIMVFGDLSSNFGIYEKSRAKSPRTCYFQDAVKELALDDRMFILRIYASVT